MCLNWSITIAQSCDPSVVNYDAMVSSFHATIIHQPDGTFQVFGEQMKPDGVAAQLSPTLINSTNYAGLTGTPLLGGVAVTGSAILLTTTGLWAWGSERILSSANTTGVNFQKVSINSKADGLPTGITPTDVKMMFVSDKLIAITTNAGNVYVISSTSVDVRGAGTSATSDTQWYQVTTSASGNPVLSNIAVARGNANGSMMALANDGKVYTWGDDTYLGNGSALATRNRATLMTLPAVFTTTNIPKEIGMTTSGLGFSSYYVLDKSGTLYSLGDNSDSQLGDFTTTTRTSWVNVKKTVSTNFTDCVYFSPNEHYLGNGSVNAIDATGQLYNWGSNAGTMLGRSGGTVDPGVPGGAPTPQISGVLYVETGGHTTVAVTSGSTKYCYVGHRINGSMGDGTATDTNESVFNCTNTGAAQVCGATSFDSGDAPATYEGNGGTDLCQHIFVSTAATLYLGATTPTANNNNLKNVAAGASNIGTNGDGAEEDGLPTVPVYTNSSTYSLPVKVKNSTGALANLYGWIDWNNNGVFDATELASATVANNATTATLNWTGRPTNLVVGTKYYMRLRLATEVLTSPLGMANTGEVEDYFLNATAPCNAGTTAPALSATTITNTCPSNTVDLTTLTVSNLPSGTTLTWHNGTPATTTNKIPGTAVPVGTYYASFYDATNSCYSGVSGTGTATTSVTATISNICSSCNVLINPSFESPVQPNINANNIITGLTFNGWTASANTQANPFNIIKVDGTGYGSGPDKAADGNQYMDIVGSAIVTQTFTVPAGGAFVKYSGSYANRDAGSTGFYNPSYNYITLLNSSGTIVGTSNAVDLIASVGDEKWFSVFGFTGTRLPAGVYTYKVVIGDYTHFDNASVCLQTAAPAGTLDCSKTQISSAPVVGVAGQKTLTVTANITAIGCFGPLIVSGSGMSLPDGFTQLCTNTTGVQTFSIPVNYDGSALSTMSFTFGALGTCTADLTKVPKKALCDVWTLECVPTAAPSLK